MIECPQCGHLNDPGSNFCSQCGAVLAAVEPGSVSDTTSTIPAITDESARLTTEETAAARLAAVDLPAGSALLIVERGPDEGARFLLDTDKTSVGRHPDSDIFLDDITVSRHHANFERTETEFRVEDLGSMNGTYVNRTLVDGSAPLRQGDEVQIGKFRMVFVVSEHGLR